MSTPATYEAALVRLEYTEVLAIDLAIKAGRLVVALDGQEQYRELRADVLDAMKVIEGLARRFDAGELP